MRNASYPDRSRRTALMLLFSRYLQGQIADPAWDRISAVLDDARLGRADRLAFAEYVNRVWDRQGEEAIPAVDVVRESIRRWSAAWRSGA